MIRRLLFKKFSTRLVPTHSPQKPAECPFSEQAIAYAFEELTPEPKSDLSDIGHVCGLNIFRQSIMICSGSDYLGL